jgi:hypothetical protein
MLPVVNTVSRFRSQKAGLPSSVILVNEEAKVKQVNAQRIEQSDVVIDKPKGMRYRINFISYHDCLPGNWQFVFYAVEFCSTE